MVRPEQLYERPNVLAAQYSRFGVSERLLLTGHSHQAWPDCSLDGQTQAWIDASEAVDAKWERAFAQAERVRQGFARLLNVNARQISLASGMAASIGPQCIGSGLVTARSPISMKITEFSRSSIKFQSRS